MHKFTLFVSIFSFLQIAVRLFCEIIWQIQKIALPLHSQMITSRGGAVGSSPGS
jgi:hypothetical protein